MPVQGRTAPCPPRPFHVWENKVLDDEHGTPSHLEDEAKGSPSEHDNGEGVYVPTPAARPRLDAKADGGERQEHAEATGLTKNTSGPERDDDRSGIFVEKAKAESETGLLWDDVATAATQRDTVKSLLSFQEDIDDIGAILDPTSYFDELDSLEVQFITALELDAMFGSRDSSRMSKMFGFRDYSRDSNDRGPSFDRSLEIPRAIRVLEQVLEALAIMQVHGFCNKHSIIALVQDPERPQIIRAVDLYVSDIHHLRSWAVRTEPGGSLVRDTTEVLDTVLTSFGAKRTRNTHEDLSNACKLLALSVAAYAASCCVDGSTLSELANSFTLSEIEHAGVGTFRLYPNDLACLQDFIGGRVWVFGDLEQVTGRKCCLSTTLRQFADLWGPVHTLPSASGLVELLAIQTEDGMMFQTEESEWASAVEGHVPLHWWSGSLVHSPRQGPHISKHFAGKRSGSDRLPSKFLAFPADARFLIGRPTASSASCTVLNDPSEVPQRDKLGGNVSRSAEDDDSSMNLTGRVGLTVNSLCKLEMSEFGKTHAFDIHPLGTCEAFYVPDELQVSLGGGQYVNVGLQKV